MSACSSTFLGKKLELITSEKVLSNQKIWWKRYWGNLPELTESLLKLSSIKLAIAVDVHSFENLAESADTNCSTARLESQLELEVKLSDLDFNAYTVECHIYNLLYFNNYYKITVLKISGFWKCYSLRPLNRHHPDPNPNCLEFVIAVEFAPLPKETRVKAFSF